MRKKEVKLNRTLVPVILVLIAIIVLVFLNIQSKEKINVQETKPSFEESLRLANEIYNKGDYVEAIRQYKKVLDIYPENIDARLSIGYSYLQLNIYDEALKYFEKPLSLDFRSYYGLGLTYYSMEDYNKAYDNLKIAYELNPKDNGAISYLVNTYNALGLYDEAIKLSNDRLELAKNDGHYYRKIGIAYLFKNDLSKAVENAKKAVELNSNYAPNHLALANVYLSMSNKEQALVEFKTALELLELIQSNPVYEGLSVTYSILGENENSKQTARLAALYPRHSFSLSLLGFALLHDKKYDKAIEEFNSAINAKPDYYLPYKGLGKAYMALGQKAKAIENFEKAIQLNNLDQESKKLLEEARK